MSYEDQATDEQIMADIESAIDDSGIKDITPTDDEIDTKDQEVESGLEGEEAGDEGGEIEAQARESGWRPKEEWDRDDKEWVDASEFLRTKPLYEQISRQSRHIKTVEKRLNAVAEHAAKVEKATREKVLAELETKRKEAIESGDLEAYDQATRQIEEKKGEDEPNFDVDEKDKIPNFVQEFADKNSWFDKDEDMTDFMLAKTQKLTAGGMQLEQAIVEAEKKVRQTFPHKFHNPKKDKPQRAMAASGESRAARMTMDSLTREQREVYESMKGYITQDDFLKQLEALG